jgi:nickel-dependent lactate racemase
MVKTYQIPFHASSIDLQIPEENVNHLIHLVSEEAEDDNIGKLKTALAQSADGPLRRWIENKRVSFIVEDSTREVPTEDLFRVILSELAAAKSIKVFLATGTHEGENEENYEIVAQIKKYAQKALAPIEKIIIHDCQQDDFYLAGVTKGYKNEIYVNAESRDAEIFVVLSDMKNHYFAGYSNALKNFLPGICKYESIERNHSLALKEESTYGHHPLHPDPLRRDNPLAQDIWEGFQLITKNRPVYTIATITKHKKILWAEVGLLERVTQEGIKQVDSKMSTDVNVADNMIVSCGGYPNDESLYTAQRALELTKNGVKEGGEILFIAGCANGIGPEKSIKNFYDPLKKDISQVLSEYQNKYIMYVHKTYKFAALIAKMNRIFIYSKLAEKIIKDIHLYPISDPQSIIDQWLQENPKTRINIFTQGNKLAVYAR